MRAKGTPQVKYLVKPCPFRGRATLRKGPNSLPRFDPQDLAQSSPQSHPKPTSRQGPTDPTLRANPCPKVTDQDCRFPLLTLVYRLEASNLGDLMRRWVQSVSKQGKVSSDTHQPLARPTRTTTPKTRVTSSLASFTDWRWCTGQHKNCVALRPPCGFSTIVPFSIHMHSRDHGA